MIDGADVVTQFNAIRDIPLWGAFIVLCGILIRQIVPWKQLTLNSEQQIRKELHDRIKELKDQGADLSNRLIRCEKECAEHKAEVERQVLGLERQHLNEQLSLVQTITDIFPDAPQLQLLKKALETGQRSVQYKGNIIGDRASNK